MMTSGAYRRITKAQADELAAAGERVEHAEGCGWIVYDDAALTQFKAASEAIRQRQSP